MDISATQPAGRTVSRGNTPGAAAVRPSPHERLRALGLKPIGRGNQFAQEVQALMSQTPLFAELDAAETLKLCNFMYVYEVPAGVTLISEGEAGDFMVLLMAGMVDVVRRNRYNQPSRIAVANAGHALGEMSMFDGEPRFASCVTLETCRMAVLARDSLLLVLQDEPRLGNKILLKLVQLLSDRLRQTSAKLVTFLESARDE
jgi:CRP-like cAMP-binding protein